MVGDSPAGKQTVVALKVAVAVAVVALQRVRVSAARGGVDWGLEGAGWPKLGLLRDRELRSLALERAVGRSLGCRDAEIAGAAAEWGWAC